jgi:hypothetical protein
MAVMSSNVSKRSFSIGLSQNSRAKQRDIFFGVFLLKHFFYSAEKL